MGRKLRNVRPGAIYHCISRIVAQQFLIASVAERRAYLATFGLGIAKSDWRCFSYAIMSNHIHLALIAGKDSFASWLRPIHTDFAQWLNEKLNRIGPVFCRGPNMIEFTPAGVSHLISYVHRNPVRAEIVSNPADSEWTSHRAYLGTGYRPTWLDVDAGLQLAGFSDGRALDAWMKTTVTTRTDLDEGRVVPLRRPGRPAKLKMGSDPI